jgi:hypothetical protein
MGHPKHLYGEHCSSRQIEDAQRLFIAHPKTMSLVAALKGKKKDLRSSVGNI